jgi:hypothetical protein
MECVGGCAGKGCHECDDKGFWELQQCPKKFVSREIVEAIRFAGFAKRGSWPVAGGVLDQSKWFVDACELIHGDQDGTDSATMPKEQ